jgi:hypothetical protein
LNAVAAPSGIDETASNANRTLREPASGREANDLTDQDVQIKQVVQLPPLKQRAHPVDHRASTLVIVRMSATMARNSSRSVMGLAEKRRLSVAEDGAERLVQFVGLEPESSPSIVTRER